MGKEKNPYHMPRTCQSAILVLQLISTFERQIFDFLGYMWLPILGNAFTFIARLKIKKNINETK